MEVIMNDRDSKDFLRDISAVHPEYKESCSAASNLITLLMKELAEQREGRKKGEKFEKMWGEAAFNHLTVTQFYDIKRKHFPEDCSEIKKQKHFSKEDKFIEELSKLVNKMIEITNDARITVKEFSERLTPKD